MLHDLNIRANFLHYGQLFNNLRHAMRGRDSRLSKDDLKLLRDLFTLKTDIFTYHHDRGTQLFVEFKHRYIGGDYSQTRTFLETSWWDRLSRGVLNLIDHLENDTPRAPGWEPNEPGDIVGWQEEEIEIIEHLCSAYLQASSRERRGCF